MLGTLNLHLAPIYQNLFLLLPNFGKACFFVANTFRTIQIPLSCTSTMEDKGMHSIKLQTHVGDDGLLQLKLPVGMTNQNLEVIVIYQPINQIPKRTWLPGFFERTFGAWQGEPLVAEFSRVEELKFEY